MTSKIRERRHRMLRRALMAGLLFVSSFGILVAAAPQASAGCAGGSGYTITHRTSAGITGRESYRYASTCDGDGYYAGRLYEGVRNGVCTVVQLYYSGSWHQHHANCVDTSWSNYSAWGGTSMRLCTTVCGVGYAFNSY
jgi:hypothetical protein